MSFTGTPTSASYCAATEQGALGANGTAGTAQDNVGGGNQTPTNWAGGTTGTPLALNVQTSAKLVLVANTPQTLDLTSVTGGPLGTKVLAKVRLVHLDHLGIADSNGTVTFSSTGTNGWTQGPIPTAGIKCSPNSAYHQENKNTAGWAVDATHRIVTFDPGNTAQTIQVYFWGE